MKATMVRVVLAVFTGAMATVLAGCGGTSTPPQSARRTSGVQNAEAETTAGQKSEVATGSTLTDFQKRRLLGHYSTRDGTSGFILDRTGTPFLAKLDGVATVMPLSESNGPYRTKEYRSSGGEVWIRVDEDGNVLLFDGPKQNEGVDVLRDADANRLR